MGCSTSSALFWLFLTVSLCLVYAQQYEETPEFWRSSANRELMKILRREKNTNVAKNVIVFLGDGMGIPTITAARILKGQRNGLNGEEGKLIFEDFPDVALIKTYNVDRQVPDSAGTATAIFSGVKTKYEMLGVSGAARPKNCSSSKGHEITSILQWAQDEGKATGIVTTTRLTHATPAALYSHSPNRYWENDGEIPENDRDCKDIARQMVEDNPGKNVKVILGGGRRHFLSPEAPDDHNNIGRRKDGKNLVNEWKKQKKELNSAHAYVTTSQELRNINIGKTDYLLGIFSDNHLDYTLDRKNDDQPTLKELTSAAIKLLKKNDKGFFLMVEGGRIDHAHHENRASKALHDTLALEDAVKEALGLVSIEDTLVLVTADHSHVMTINGYPVRGTGILGVGDVSDVDYLPYTTLMYTTGPSANNKTLERRVELNGTSRALDDNYQQLSMVPTLDETHGGEDVAVYAMGPMSHLFSGVQEQNYIAHAMGYASCLGENRDHCKSNSSKLNGPFFIVLILIIITVRKNFCK